MKNVIRIFVMIGMFLLISCRGDDEIGLSGVRFQMNICKCLLVNSLSKTSEAPYSVVITVSDGKRQIWKDKVLSVEDLKTQLLYFKPGDYYVQKLLVKDEEDELIYIAPVFSSDFSKFVDITLPLKFTVKNNENAIVSIDVLPFELTSSLESYGYNSLGFRIIEAFKFALCVKSALNKWPIRSHVKIFGKYQDPNKKDRVLLDEDLSAGVWMIPVSNIYHKFEIHAESHGYLPQVVTKTFTELKDYVPVSRAFSMYTPLSIYLPKKVRK